MQSSSSTDRIRALSNKAITCNDPEELKQIFSDLREALREHLQGLKDKVAKRATKAKTARG